MKSTLIALVIFLGSIWLLLAWSSSSPGTPFQGAQAALSSDEQESAGHISEVCEALSQDIGSRGAHAPAADEETRDFLRRELRRMRVDSTEIELDCAGVPTKAYEVVLVGRGLAKESIVLGAHYDCRPGSPGADDNASGVAVLLEVLRIMSGSGYDRTVRFVFWGAGAGAVAGTDKSGAWAYARRLRSRKEQVAAVLCFDRLGIYKDAPGTQSIPLPMGLMYPKRGDFVAFVGDWGVHSLLDKSSEEFRRVCRFPSQSISLPSSLSFIADSDDGAFRENGFGAIRVTDTGSWRSPSVGTAADNLRTLDCTRMGRLAHGLAQTVTGLAKKTLSLL